MMKVNVCVMAYRLNRKESIKAGVRRVACEQLEKALKEIDDPELAPHETVHQVRKRMKKLRGLIRLVRPALGKTYQRENARFRESGSDLSAIRDAQAMIEAWDRLREGGDAPGFDAVREFLVNRRDEIARQQVAPAETLSSLKTDILTSLDRAASWKLKAGGFEAVSGGFLKTYRRGRKGFQQATNANAAVEDYHEWRKRVKYHWYHCRLLENVNKDVMTDRRSLAKELADRLGDDHDLSLLAELIATEFPSPDDSRSLLARIENSQKSLRGQTQQLGAKLYAQKAKHFQNDLEAWWRGWR